MIALKMGEREPRETAARIAELVERMRSGDVRALARAISLIENGSPLAGRLLSACFPHSGKALRIGITGAPGAGKSTLVDKLARLYRGRQQTVGVVAVDPTSPYTGGAILGDRIRMQENLGDAGFYVRSMATRGALGGLAETTADAATVIEASGKDVVLLETVGVGQDEVDVVRLADVTIVVLVPGMGDDVQSLKAGIMEIADIFVINKSDREGADRVEKEVRALQSLAGRHGGWVPPVVRTVATSGEGVAELVASIDEFRRWLSAEGRGAARRRAYWRQRLVEMVRLNLLRAAERQGLSEADLESYAAAITEGRQDPYALAPVLVSAVLGNRKKTAQEAGTDAPDAAPRPSLDHLGIAVESIAEASGFYRAAGLEVASEETVEHEQVRTAMIPMGGSRIELLEPLSEESPVGRFLRKRGAGVHHVALRVKDIAAKMAELKGRGVRLVSENIQVGAGGHLYFFVHPASTGGVLVEFCQEAGAGEADVHD